MKKKKILRVWQLVIIEALLVALISTIIMPAYRFNEAAAEKMADTIADMKEEDDDPITEDEKDSIVDTIDQMLSLAKEAYSFTGSDVDLDTISVWEIMTHDIVGDFDSYNMIQMLLWLVYGAILLLMIFNILACCLKFPKWIAVLGDELVAIAGAVLFGILHFSVIRSFVKNVIDSEESLMWSAVKNYFTDHYFDTFSVDTITKVVCSFRSFAFLAGFIFAVILAVIVFVFLFIGNQREVYIPDDNLADQVWMENPSDPSQQMEIPPQQMEMPLQQTEMPPQNQVSWQQTLAPEQRRPSNATQICNQEIRPAMGKVQIIKGDGAGSGLMLPEGRKVVIGKNLKNANLVINNPHVSGVHCSIAYNAQRNVYIVKDHSMNGVYVNGKRLVKESQMILPPGTVLVLADGSNQVLIG